MTDRTMALKGSLCVFPAAELALRAERLDAAMQRQGLDALLATSPEDIFWLSGQQSPGYYALQLLLLPRGAQPVLLVRELERVNAVANTRIDRIVACADEDDPVEMAGRLLAEHGLSAARVGLDRTSWFPSPAVLERLERRTGRFAEATQIVGRLRLVKSELELGFLSNAAAMADAGMRAAAAALRPGADENQIAAASLSALVEAGSEYLAMEPLVAAGARAGVPHATWRRRPIPDGSAVLVGLAGCCNRYHAALQRSLALGAPPADARRIFDACEEALAVTLAAIRPGVRCDALHAACVDVIARHGLEPNFRKRSGYSIGIAFAPDWGEGHLLSFHAGETRALEAGMVFHVPPACRIFGETGAGVSETVVVTANGCRPLGTVPRDLGWPRG